MDFDAITIALLVGICLVLVALRFFSIMEGAKADAAHQKRIRREQAPRDAVEARRLLDSIVLKRLGLDPAGLSLDARWVEDLRIPRGELAVFFDEVASAFSIDDESDLERTRTFRETMESLGLPVGE